MAQAGLVQAGLVIVGAGETGARAALTLRAEGYDGPLTLIGEEPHPPYERPPLSKSLLVSPEPPTFPAIADAAGLGERGVDVIAPVLAASIDRAARTLHLSDGRALAYDKLLLATGARARRLTIAGGETALTLRSYDEALALRRLFAPGKTIAIVGGGFIGLELAASASALGCKVNVIEAAPRILMRGVPAALAEIIAARHRSAGVALRVGAAIGAITHSGGRVRVALADGDDVEADTLIAGIGAAPETDLAQRAGLTIDNGVAVDGRLQTSDPHIYAAGDCASFPHPLYAGRRVRLEAWRNAIDQGAFVARSLLGATDAYSVVPWFWSDQYELNLQIAGLADAGQTTIARDLGEGALLLFHLADDGRLVAASGLGPLGKIAKEVRLAEMLIGARARPAPDALASPKVKLKALLAG